MSRGRRRAELTTFPFLGFFSFVYFIFLRFKDAKGENEGGKYLNVSDNGCVSRLHSFSLGHAAGELARPRGSETGVKS